MAHNSHNAFYIIYVNFKSCAIKVIPISFRMGGKGHFGRDGEYPLPPGKSLSLKKLSTSGAGAVGQGQLLVRS